MSRIMTKEILSCSCFDDDHDMIVCYDRDENREDWWDNSLLYLSLRLHPFENFWNRFWVGIKYIINKKKVNLDCIILDEDNFQEWQDCFNSFEIRGGNVVKKVVDK